MAPCHSISWYAAPQTPSMTAWNVQWSSAVKIRTQRRTTRKAVLKQQPKKSGTVVVEEYISKQPPEGVWIQDHNLFDSDKKILLSPHSYLNDNLTNAAQKLLKKSFPALPGLQGAQLGIMAFDIQRGKFIQILHDGRDHWLLISTVGVKHPTVQVYDSMYQSIGSHTKKQIASLLHTDSSDIKIHMINTQRQTGGSDCGLFAIAFATAIAFGLQPEDYCFNQAKMREHLIRCLEAGKMFFPYSRPRRRVNRVKATFSVPIYCSCRMPDVFKAAWIECTKCKTWYHSGTCAKVPQEVLRNKRSPWFCSDCVL